MEEMIFVHFDGDDVGSKLELMLLNDEERQARLYSDSINVALAHVRELLTRSGAEIVFSGGDDLVARWEMDHAPMSAIENARKVFGETCGRTLSAGIGSRLSDAASNLRRAKLQGKNQCVQTLVSLH